MYNLSTDMTEYLVKLVEFGLRGEWGSEVCKNLNDYPEEEWL